MSLVSTRVRFAPSPTGMFHVGGARSALYNWAVARQSGGKYVLRIEDTDAARNKPEWIDGIISALASIGISKDDPAFEGPYFQSQNADRHSEAAQHLYAEGRAYYCDCTREQLPERTGSQHLGYDGFCRDRGLEYVEGRLEDYLAEGYLPEAMTNYLMLLGWGPGDDIELRPYEELEEKFRVEDVNTSPAFFDIKKLTAFNGEYIRALPLEKFIEACEPWLRAPYANWAPEDFDRAAWEAIAPHAQTRLAVLSDITANVDFLFLKEPVEDDASWAKAMKGDPSALLTTAHVKLEAADWTSPESLKEAVLAAGEEHSLKLGKAQAPVRVAVTGRTVGLPLFESLEVLGKDHALARIDAALAKLAG